MEKCVEVISTLRELLRYCFVFGLGNEPIKLYETRSAILHGWVKLKQIKMNCNWVFETFHLNSFSKSISVVCNLNYVHVCSTDSFCYEALICVV